MRNEIHFENSNLLETKLSKERFLQPSRSDKKYKKTKSHELYNVSKNKVAASTNKTKRLYSNEKVDKGIFNFIVVNMISYQENSIEELNSEENSKKI